MTDFSLFGPVPERNVTFLIDTSGSMYFCLRTVQDNLVEALLTLAEKDNSSFNVLEFSRHVNAWADRCVSCNSQTVAAAARWIRTREASTGNDLPEAILMAFDDQTCDALYVVSNSLPAQRKNDVIDGTLFVSKGRPVNCIYLASSLSDPSAEEFLHDLAWESGGSFKIMQVSESGRFQQATLVFGNEQRRIRSTTGRVYPKDKYCSVMEHPLVTASAFGVPNDLDLPWQSHYSPLWWTPKLAPAIPSIPTMTYEVDSIPLTRYHAARALLREDEIRDTILGTPALPGAGMLLIDKKVLARRIEDGYYYLGRVKSEVSRDRFLVQFDELNKGKYRNTTFQEVWIYDIISFVDAFRHPIIPGDKVLVPVESGKYAPAVVLQGHEQRSDPIQTNDRKLIVNHLDGRSETLQVGLAIWIPNKLYERVSFELRLPYAARKTLESHIGYPEKSTLQTDNAKEDEVVEVDDSYDEVELEGDAQYEEVLVDENPYNRGLNLHEYYDKLYSQWPWWWKMWYQRFPVPRPMRRPPRVIRRTKIISSPERIRVQRSPSPRMMNNNEKCEHDLNFVDYEDVRASTAYLRRVHEKEEIDNLTSNDAVPLTYRRTVSPNRLSYSDNAGTQTLEYAMKRASAEYSRKPRGDERPPWRYWRIEEPPVLPSNIRASTSPTRRRLELEAQMRKTAQRRDTQRWFETPTVPRQKPTSNEFPNDVEYRKLETYERHQIQPIDIKHGKEFVDYVAADRGAAEWNGRTEPKLRIHHHHHHHHRRANDDCNFQREPIQYGGGRYVARESTYYDDYQPRRQVYYRDDLPPAGLPTLNTPKMAGGDDQLRSRRAHHLQRMATQEARVLRDAERTERDMAARASYNASAAAFFADKEQRSFDREQDKIAALQRKRAEVDAHQRRDVNAREQEQKQRTETSTMEAKTGRQNDASSAPAPPNATEQVASTSGK